jgi:hypothetical protein
MPTFEMEACEGCSIEINKEVRAPEQGRFTTRNYRLLCFLVWISQKFDLNASF